MSLRVTVFIPVFNSEKYIGTAIESILAQTWADFELLVIDDGSTDATAAVIARYTSDARLRVIFHDRNQGQPATRNEGLDCANGEYIALLDADDYCAPDRLMQQASYLDNHPEIAVLGTWIQRVDEHGTAMPQEKADCVAPEPADVAIELLFGCPMHHPTIMARTDVLAAYRYNENYAGAEDYDLLTRLIDKYKIANLPQQLVFYRCHAAQATAVRKDVMRDDADFICGRQLAALGMKFEPGDLRRQDLMRCGNRVFRARTGRGIDLIYVRWGRHWLERLMQANTVSRRYQEPNFSRFLARIWAQLCRKGARDAGPLVWREFADSSLKRAVASAWWHDVRAREKWRGRR